MTDQEQKNLRAYCAFLLKEYGFDMPPDDPVIPALYVIHKEMELNSKTNGAIGKRIDEAVKKLNPTVYNFHDGDASFMFQMGKAVKWAIGGVLFLILLAIANWHWSMKHDVETARAMIRASGRIEALIKQVRHDEDDNLFIDFQLAHGDSIHFSRDYFVLDAKTVRVYVARKPD